MTKAEYLKKAGLAHPRRPGLQPGHDCSGTAPSEEHRRAERPVDGEANAGYVTPTLSIPPRARHFLRHEFWTHGIDDAREIDGGNAAFAKLSRAVKRFAFRAELLGGHKGPAIIVPFGPQKTWGIAPIPVVSETYGDRPGYLIKGMLNGHAFDGWIGNR